VSQERHLPSDDLSRFDDLSRREAMASTLSSTTAKILVVARSSLATPR
jgi:hypothetical protein